ncbi:MAG: AAA family ATPase [Gemmatimonadetes bacterium]|nr:AAA family ATPase [Gemmatimonadota bacterium]MYD25229.1 AAA family ATPase [Gemmatimonadota bacterium]
MRSVTGPWVSGDDFFDRESELDILERRIRNGNHVLLTGQRRMGKTSVARELGCRLKAQEWVFLFVDVEDATCPEDVIADVAEAANQVRTLKSRITTGTLSLLNRLSHRIKGIGPRQFRVSFRAELNIGNWRRFGEKLIRDCADHDQPVLLVIDELPIFLKRMLSDDEGHKKVDEFLSWLRGALQRHDGSTPVLMVSGSIGLAPLVRRLGIPDRINYLYPFRLGPWNREICIECFDRLVLSSEVQVESGVAEAVYDKLGMGIPHHVQYFFARLTEHAHMHDKEGVAVSDVDEVYHSVLLGPVGQSDLAHYETRLEDGLADELDYSIAKDILSEAATQDVFGPLARRGLEQIYAPRIGNVAGRISEVLGILVHDGYLDTCDAEYRFPSNLLKDWWAARFGNHYSPIEQRSPVRNEQSLGFAVRNE